MRRSAGSLPEAVRAQQDERHEQRGSVSDSASSSLIQMLGYTATRKAAMSPARRPAISRPVMPHTVTAAAPMTQHHTRWAKNDFNPTTEVGRQHEDEQRGPVGHLDDLGGVQAVQPWVDEAVPLHQEVGGVVEVVGVAARAAVGTPEDRAEPDPEAHERDGGQPHPPAPACASCRDSTVGTVGPNAGRCRRHRGQVAGLGALVDAPRGAHVMADRRRSTRSRFQVTSSRTAGTSISQRIQSG